jgi:3-phosphoshikimate 1-carboxyvinyltransferase
MTAGSLAPTTLTMRGPCELSGTLAVPGDKSISHRALLLAAQAPGECVISGLSGGDDVVRTRTAVELLGARTQDLPEGRLLVHGGLHLEPEQPLDHGNSGTGIRLMAGVVSGYDLFVVLTGDESLRRRPMDRIAVPLREMGARIDGRGGGSFAPLSVRGGGLRGIRYQSPVASAQVKSAVLLAAVNATGPATVVEPVATRRHTEEMLRDFGVDVAVDGLAVTVTPGPLRPADVRVPGDPSQAAFWIVGALVAPAAEVAVDGIYLGHGRAGFLDVLHRMGAPITVDRGSGTVGAAAAPLSSTSIEPADVSSLVDEVPILAVAAASAPGTTVLRGLSELRVKESDRIGTTVTMLRAFGASAHETADSIVVEGGKPLRGGQVDSGGDHRIAMAAAMAALRADGNTAIRGWEAVATSYPGFDAELNRLTNGTAQAFVTPTG